MENLKILNISEDSKLLFKQCFDSNLSPKKIENIEWQFLRSPEQTHFVNIAYDERAKKTAGIYATFSVPFKLDDKNVLGSQSLDTMTDIDYRGKGLFISLAKNVFKNSADNGIALVYGFPNGNSVHGFKKKLDWQILDPVPFLIRPLKTSYFTSKIKFLKFLPNLSLKSSRFINKTNLVLKELSDFPDEVNNIWIQFSKNFKVAVIRDASYLQWRYLEKPNEDYKIVHCYDKAGKYLGFIVYVLKVKHGGRIGYIMELIYDVAKPEVGDLLVSYAVQALKDADADCILSWCLSHSPNYKAFTKRLFFSLPEKFRPIELHFGARSFNEEMKVLIENRTNWYLSYSDSDTV